MNPVPPNWNTKNLHCSTDYSTTVVVQMHNTLILHHVRWHIGYKFKNTRAEKLTGELNS